jgi:RND superfamily putative drug exporter
MSLMGRWNWWVPGWLDRLPTIDVEGSDLDAPAPVAPVTVPADDDLLVPAGR